MKNILIIDIDTDRKETVHIGKPANDPKFKKDKISHQEFAETVLTDMASLCEALCTLIHTAENAGIKKSPDSLRDCIKHLTDGFADASYKAHSTQIPKE